jgi:2-phospho-L-lactate guanylyltransferase
MDVLVPFDARSPKQRLGPELDANERREFAEAMLADVLDALDASGADATVLSTAPLGCSAPVVVDERPLSEAVNARLDARPVETPLAVVMADLALATPVALSALLDREGDVVLAAGRGGGTNALVVRASGFRVDYHGASLRDHRLAADAAGLDLAEVDSFQLSTDIDEPTDLVEVLLHNEGRASAWLRDAGYRVHTGDSRVRAERR